MDVGFFIETGTGGEGEREAHLNHRWSEAWQAEALAKAASNPLAPTIINESRKQQLPAFLWE